MNRNFQRRVETMFPIEDPALRSRILEEILATQLADNCRTRLLRANGLYERIAPAAGEPTLRSQQRFIELAKMHTSGALSDRGLVIRPTLRLAPRPSDASTATGTPPRLLPRMPTTTAPPAVPTSVTGGDPASKPSP